MAFGEEATDEHGGASTTKGRVRTFITRVNLQASQTKPKYFESLFSTNKNSTDENGESDSDNSASQNTTQEKAHEFRTAIRGKMILFDGYYREKEIDLFFGINPTSKIDEQVFYQ